MDAVDLSTRGLDEEIAKLSGFDLAAVIHAPLERGIIRIHGDMAFYPSAPSTSTYRRTGTYGRTWVDEVTGLTARTLNATQYAPFVGDALKQTAALHRIGWTTDKEAVEKRLPVIEDDIAAAIIKAVS